MADTTPAKSPSIAAFFGSNKKAAKPLAKNKAKNKAKDLGDAVLAIEPKKRKLQTTGVKAAKARPVPDAEEIAILRKFDLNSVDFGPCVNITRRDRWERAQRNHAADCCNKAPPQLVLDIIMRYANQDPERVDVTENLWHSQLGYFTDKAK